MAVTNEHRHPAEASRGAPSHDRLFARAWTWIALIPVFFFVGFAVGEVLYASFGYRPENDDAPLMVDLVASVAALAVALVPCLGAVVDGRRAERAGRRSALVPAAIGAVVGTGLVVLTALST